MTTPQADPETRRPPARVAVSPDMLRIVLFGMPDAGKSSLLGALAQASQTQERALGGRLTDLTHGLSELQRRVYDDRPRETLEEIVPYPVTFDPLNGPRIDTDRREQAVLYDCDGRAANNLLSRRDGLADDAPAGSLAEAVTDADALVLVVDAGASPAQVDSDLAEFVRFLRLFQRQRGERSEVGGLPVFLVLSKSDLLAQPGDTPAQWAERVEQRKAEVGRRFRGFLQEGENKSDVAFGDLDLELSATAVKRPALAGSPAQPREPWGVAELFRRAIAEAEEFRERRSRSQRRLFWTVLWSAAVVAGLGLFGVALALNRQSIEPVPLQSKVENFRAREGQTPSVRLSEPLPRKISELTELANDPDFPRLTPEQQQYLKGRLAELTAYRDYKERLSLFRPPAEARSLEELAELERRLREDFTPPDPYRDEWGQTDALLLRQKYLDDIQALRRAATDVSEWYRQVTQRGNKLLLFAERTADNAPLPWAQWQESVEALLRETASPPFRRTERLRESHALPGAPAVTYATVLDFPSVDRERAPWDRVRLRLERLRDITQALGLGSGGRPAVLRLPESWNAAQAGDLLAALKQYYPRYGEWSLADLPDVVVPEVRQAAQLSYQRAIDAGRAVVRQRYRDIAPDGKETLAAWRQVADWLPAAPELREWRELANALLRLSDPNATDPVTALATFLRLDRFELSLSSARLTIPDDLKDLRLRPQGPFTISVQESAGSVQKLTFRRDGDGTHDPRRRVTTYTFTAEKAAPQTIRPGDAVWADIPLRDANGGDWQLSWWANGTRSSVYQTEHLVRPPRLHRPNQEADAGELVEGVDLAPVPERGLPRVPDLLPRAR